MMKTDYGMETTGPNSIDLKDIPDKTSSIYLTEKLNAPKENVTAPKGYGKKLYAKATRVYREAKVAGAGSVVAYGALMLGLLLLDEFDSPYSTAKRNEKLAEVGFVL